MSRYISKHQSARIQQVKRNLVGKGYSFHVRPGKPAKAVAVVRFEQGMREVKAIKEGKLKGGSLRLLFDGE
jgi:hypothetical protein